MHGGPNGRSRLTALLLPEGVERRALILLVARGLRGVCDGFIAVLLPAYMLALGFGQLVVGLISTTTLFGSAFATLLVGLAGNRFAPRGLLRIAAVLMMATGLAFAGLSSLWPLLVVAFVGTLNPGSGRCQPVSTARTCATRGIGNGRCTYHAVCAL